MRNPVRRLCLTGTLFLSIAAADALQAFTVTDYGVTIDRIRFGPEIVHCFCTDLWGTDIAGATITSPPDAIPPNTAYALAFDVDEDQWAYDEIDSANATDAKFPDGTYRFDVTYTDDSTETIFVELNRAFPPFPVVLSFDSDALSWQPWDGLPNGLSIEVYIEAEDESSHECDLPTGATSCALPPGFVEAGSMYFVDVLFLSGSVPHAFTNSGWIATLTPGFVLGDVDGDGTVGVLDFLALLAAWGPCPGPCPPSCAADFDSDCQVGITDFLLLLANWG